MENKQSVSFFVCVAGKDEYEAIRSNLGELVCPKGLKVFILWVKSDLYNGSVYNQVVRKDNSKYKVYIHSGVRIVNTNFISDMLSVFSKNQIAMIGFWGTLEKPTSANWYDANNKIGKAWTADNGDIVEKAFFEFKNTTEVRWLDGCCFATQCDMLWQEVFESNYFSVLSYCEELARLGKKLVVPYQEKAWCYYDSLNEPVIDAEERARYFEMYAPYLMLTRENCPINNMLFLFGRNSNIHEDWRVYGSEGISIGNDVSIQKSAWLLLPYDNYSGEPRIIIGDGCDLGYRLSISAANKVILEEHVLIAANVHITDHNHNYDLVGVPIRYQGISSFSNVVVVGRGSWIANNVVIAGNVKIGKGCAIGANSVVTSDIPSYCVAVGSPARVVKAFDCQEKRWVKIKSDADFQRVMASRPKREDTDKHPLVDMHIFEQKNIIKLFVRDGNYEVALSEIAYLASLLCEYHQFYTDDILEDYLLEIANRISLPVCNRELAEIKSLKQCTVLFYDGFGLDVRGLAQVYLEALIDLNCHIVYVTKETSKGRIPTLLNMLERGESEVIYLAQADYIKTTRLLNDIIVAKKPDVGFLYIEPYDLPGILAFNNAKGRFTRYLINFMDSGFWLGKNAFDYCLEFRQFGAALSKKYRKISSEKLLLQPYCAPARIRFVSDTAYHSSRKNNLQGDVISREEFRNNLFKILMNGCSQVEIKHYDIERDIDATKKRCYDRFILSHPELLQDF